jgi:hypothetical protein
MGGNQFGASDACPSSDRPARLRRRDMITGTAAGAVAAGLAGGAEAKVGEPATQADTDPRRLSYRETQHIRQYYARARM